MRALLSAGLFSALCLLLLLKVAELFIAGSSPWSSYEAGRLFLGDAWTSLSACRLGGGGRGTQRHQRKV